MFLSVDFYGLRQPTVADDGDGHIRIEFGDKRVNALVMKYSEARALVAELQTALSDVQQAHRDATDRAEAQA